MTEHLTKRTEYDEHPDWCARCQKHTMHRRRPGDRTKGKCMNPPHLTDQENADQFRRQQREIAGRQQELFP